MRPKQFATCRHCGAEFQKRRATHVYCSRSCLGSDLHARGIVKPRERTGIMMTCPVCSKEFYIQKYRIGASEVHYCSRSCLAKVHLPKFDAGFKPTGKTPHTYKTITINGKQVREHRYIMEQRLGRKLSRDEHVHHDDDNSRNNDPNNLMVLSNADHQRLELFRRGHTKKKPPIS